jgi:galactonate dehydratase
VRTRIAVYHHHLYSDSFKTTSDMLKRTKAKAVKTTVDRVTGTTGKADPLDPDVRRDWSVTNRQIDEIVAHVAGLREAIGPDLEIAIECHTMYNTESAIRIAKALEPFRPMWLEEPIPPDNPDAMALIRRSTSIPIAGGENLYTRHGFRPFIEKQALGVIQPDMLKCGGLLESRKIAAMAEIYSIPMAPHGVASPLGKQAMAHICATTPNFKILEWALNPGGAQLTEAADLRDGYVFLSDKPGIGIELIPEMVKERLLPEFPFPA